MTNRERGRRHTGDRGHQPSGDSRRASDTARLPQNYLQGGYFRDDGKIRKEVFTDWAEELARILSNEGLTTNQVRKVFAGLRIVESRYAYTRDFEQVIEDLHKVHRMVIYARHRGVIRDAFYNFMAMNKELAEKDEKHFHAFIEHYQSLVAYSTKYLRT